MKAEYLVEMKRGGEWVPMPPECEEELDQQVTRTMQALLEATMRKGEQR